jgi:hypothetical protein
MTMTWPSLAMRIWAPPVLQNVDAGRARRKALNGCLQLVYGVMQRGARQLDYVHSGKTMAVRIQ